MAVASGDDPGKPFHLEHDTGQRLADLIVKLARDPASLGLLKTQGAARAVAPLGTRAASTSR
jgi:hypothetical protein